MNMELTPEQEERILMEITDRVWAHVLKRLDEITCVSIPRAAGMLDLSTAQARRAFPEVIDFGPQLTRISLADLQRLIDARRTKRKAAGRRKKS